MHTNAQCSPQQQLQRVFANSAHIKAAGTRIAKRLGTGGTLTTVFAVLIFVVAAYMLWKSAAAFL